MNANLSAKDVESIHRGLIEKVYAEHRETLDLVTPTRAAGFLDVSIKTLEKIDDLPRIEITSKVIRYKLSDLRDWQMKHRKIG